jgi:hypothetical protein
MYSHLRRGGGLGVGANLWKEAFSTAGLSSRNHIRRIQQNKHPAAEAAFRCQQRIVSGSVDDLKFENAIRESALHAAEV